MTAETAKPQPTQEALLAAYTGTAQIYAADGQGMWQRMATYLAFSTALGGALIATLQFGGGTANALRLAQGLAIIGACYGVVQLITSAGAWRLYLNRAKLLRKQEQALALGELGSQSGIERLMDHKHWPVIARFLLWLLADPNPIPFEGFTTCLIAMLFVIVVISTSSQLTAIMLH